MGEIINVTESFLPPIQEFVKHIQRAYENRWLTNRGELVIELEEKLKNYLKLSKTSILCVNNGTFPIQVALKLFGNGGEIITTPFSYIATTSAILWENCLPVFVDIHPNYLTIDETKIEHAITTRTTCILATHVFGNICNVEAIEKIANKYNLKVIYDAAHCFGVNYKGRSIFEYGDISTCSFHATKLFHTAEGGAIFSKKEEMKKIFLLHNFGHSGPGEIQDIGVNGKLSEIQAAMGLSVLPYMSQIIKKRKEIHEQYMHLLSFKTYRTILIREFCNWNFSYFPIIFENEKQLIRVFENLKRENIFVRRYFRPSLNTLSFSKRQTCEISEGISDRVLSLPISHKLEYQDLCRIVNIIDGAN